MEISMSRIHLLVFSALVAWTSPAHATVTPITNKNQWLSAIGSHEFIGFTGFPEFTTITTQYQEQGITFTDGNDFIFITGSFPSDGHGLVSSDTSFPGTVHMSFEQPRYAIAFEFTGRIQIELYENGSNIFTSIHYVDGFTPFVWFLSTVPFDAAIALDPVDSILTLDNVYFGAAVPAPGALLGLAFGSMCVVGRRRRSAL
jgi:hypothetical protein